MGEFLDRAYQKQLLEGLRSVYPATELYQPGTDELARRRSVNLHYLLEHELISGKAESTYSDGISYVVRINAKGLDFLQGDGGLSAILGVVTVKLHDETILKLMDGRIDADLAATDVAKTEAKSALRRLPEAVLKTLVEEITKKGLDHFPDLLPWIVQHGHTALHAASLGGM